MNSNRNKNRNEFVIDMNVHSKSVEKTLSLIDSKLVNIIETERNKVFDVVDFFRAKGLDFWSDDFAFREIFLEDMTFKVVEAINCFNNVDNSLFARFKSRDVFFKGAKEQYNEFNKRIGNYDVSREYYRTACNYCEGLYVSSNKSGLFYQLYVELCSIGRKIDAIETENYNNQKLFDILSEKERDAEILQKLDLGIENLSDDDISAMLDVAIKNYLQVLKVTNIDEYNKMSRKVNRRTRKK